LTLAKEGLHARFVDSGRDLLAAVQQQDGRISYPNMPNVFWPTSLAVLAWHGSRRHQDAQNRALHFLLETSGDHWKMDPNAPTAHDTSIKGWSWSGGTHSFVEPTALSLIALDINGHSKHARFQEGTKMIMNRQIPHGGWNYGNTLVYGKELRPFLDTTGIALTALSGHVAKEDVKSSLQFLDTQVQSCRTPLSLGWALLGLGAWGEFPLQSHEWIQQSLERQIKFGSYRTSLASILALASLGKGDFRRCFERK
jgi:hypothetical protein